MASNRHESSLVHPPLSSATATAVQPPKLSYNRGRMDEASTSNEAISASSKPTPRIGNINSPSVSLASVSSEDGSGNGHDRCAGGAGSGTMASSSNSDINEVKELDIEVRRLKDSLSRLRRVFEDCAERPDAIRKVNNY